MKAEEYLGVLTEQIRCKKARSAVRNEIERHVEEQKETFLHAGLNEKEAEIAAVEEMGTP